jgi:hypothetical protein
MPSKSRFQHDFFQAIAHSPEFAKKVGVKQEVGKDFTAADKAEGKYQKKDSDKNVKKPSHPK